MQFGFEMQERSLVVSKEIAYYKKLSLKTILSRNVLLKNARTLKTNDYNAWYLIDLAHAPLTKRKNSQSIYNFTIM